MKRDDDKRPPERITKAQDGYPESWGHGMFGSAYKRTWFTRPGDAIPRLGRKDET
jgi:hypothetical protein